MSPSCWCRLLARCFSVLDAPDPLNYLETGHLPGACLGKGTEKGKKGTLLVLRR